MDHGGKTFSKDIQVYGCDVKIIKLDKPERKIEIPHENVFRYPSPAKKVSIFSKGTSIAERGGSKRKELKS